MDTDVQQIMRAALEVHAQLGPGYLETVYQEALALELALRGIGHDREVHVPVFYKGRPLTNWYRADFVCGAVVVELKATGTLVPRDDLQLRSYLKAIGKHQGLLLNFGKRRLQMRRVMLELEAELEGALPGAERNAY